MILKMNCADLNQNSFMCREFIYLFGNSQEYKACGPPNPPTCRNICFPSLKLPIECVEGCFCPNNTVYHNKKCILHSECPCFRDDFEYAPNSLIIDNCQHWYVFFNLYFFLLP